MELRRRQAPVETPADLYNISSTRPGPGREGLAAAPGEHRLDTGARSKGREPWQNWCREEMPIVGVTNLILITQSVYDAKQLAHVALVAIAEAVHLESGRVDVDEAMNGVDTDRLSVHTSG